MSFRDVIREKKGSNTTPTTITTSTTSNQQQQPLRISGGGGSTSNTNNKRQPQQSTSNNKFNQHQQHQIDIDQQEDNFNEICSEIEKLLTEITKSTLSIQKSTNTILGTSKDTHEHRESLSLIIKKSAQKVEYLLSGSNLLGKLELFKNELKFDKKIQKLKNQMEQILNEYKKQTTNCLKVQKETLMTLNRNSQKNSQDSNYGNSNYGNHSNEKSHLLSQQQQHDEQLDNEIEFNTKILHEREQDILEVESSIREINGIFKELHFLTIQQGEGLDLIEDRIEETSHRIEQGRENIVVAEKRSKMGRNLFCILLLIFLALGAAIAIVLVVLKVVGII